MAPRTTTQILWSDGWAWLANRVGVMSTPGRTDMLKKPTRVTHQALLSDQGLNIVVVFAHLGPLQAEALQQLASVGKTSRFWGLRASERERFKGEWTRRLWGRINTRNIEGQQNKEFLEQTSEGTQWFEGNLTRRDMVEEWVPSSISLKTIEWANVKNSERE